MSKSVIVVCTLILLLGVAGLLDMASGFSGGRLSFNIAVLLLPVGLGLSLSIPGSRLAATLVFGVFYVVLALMLVSSFLQGTKVELSLFGFDSPIGASSGMILVFVAMIGTGLALLHRSLFSQAFDEHLNG